MAGVRCSVIFFFFQAEDGIRDIGVTGVQTCALPIWRLLAVTWGNLSPNFLTYHSVLRGLLRADRDPRVSGGGDRERGGGGKRGGVGGGRIIKKKKSNNN